MTPLPDTHSALPRGLYRHYKGNDYRVLGTVIHSETEEVMVLYLPLYQAQPDLWVRPLSMFCESVQTENGPVPRFQLISGAE